MRKLGIWKYLHISTSEINSFRGNYSFLEVGVRQLFKGGNYSKEETIVLWQFLTLWHCSERISIDFNLCFHYSQTLKSWQQLCFFSTKTSYLLVICFKNILLDSNDAICLAKSNIILELKEKTAQVRKLFKEGNYSREETINY